jgi:hypothetical protein
MHRNRGACISMCLRFVKRTIKDKIVMSFSVCSIDTDLCENGIVRFEDFDGRPNVDSIPQNLRRWPPRHGGFRDPS